MSFVPHYSQWQFYLNVIARRFLFRDAATGLFFSFFYIHFVLIQNEPKNQNDWLGNYQRYHSLIHLNSTIFINFRFQPLLIFKLIFSAHYFWKSLLPTLSELHVNVNVSWFIKNIIYIKISIINFYELAICSFANIS